MASPLTTGMMSTSWGRNRPAAFKAGLAPGLKLTYGADGKPSGIVNQDGSTYGQVQVPTSAPAGSYDPAYDAQLENANMGFLFGAQDYATNKGQLATDYTDNAHDINQQSDYRLADLLANKDRTGQDYTTNKDRLGQDYGTQTGRLGQDYGTQTQALNRQYTNLGTQQDAAGRAAGVGEGGALAQAMLARQANQGIDQQGIDTGYQRQTADAATQFGRQGSDLNTGWDRYQQDYGTNVNRSNDTYHNQVRDLDKGTFRGNSALDTGYQRLGIQNDANNRQVGTQELYAAAQNGGLPDLSVQNVTQNGMRYTRLPTGQLIPAANFKGYSSG